MFKKDLVLGIDTSNYTTSIALTHKEGAIITDKRKLLEVKQGERGLRQSHALFQHIENLPDMITEMFGYFDKERIGAVSVSSRPRPVEGSYMPVFKAGINYGRVLSASLGVPLFEFSHQEGHIEAVKKNCEIKDEAEFLAYHLSGGTCELLYIDKNNFNIIGESKDISFGQVIDRVGVSLGMKFPAGMQMDEIACSFKEKLKIENEKSKANEKSDEKLSMNSDEKLNVKLKKIKIDDYKINLSGIETQCQRAIENGAPKAELIYELFFKIGQCICELTELAVAKTNCSKIIFTGGVTASQFLREYIIKYFEEKSVIIVFGDMALSSDNAVGIAFLGGKKLWQSNL